MGAHSPWLSIVVPVRNDAEALVGLLEQLAKLSEPGIEVIVADASDDDACVAIAKRFGANVVRCEAAGRGMQLNAGAKRAQGEILVFNHADTFLETGHIDSLQRVAGDPEIVGGAFFKDLRSHYPMLAWAGEIVRWYTRDHGIIYGDQSCFVRRGQFEAMGGFANIPLMEDVEFSRRLRKSGGKLAFLDPPLRTSMRRFKKRGLLRNRLQNVGYVWLFRCGVSAETLYEWYYGEKSAS